MTVQLNLRHTGHRPELPQFWPERTLAALPQADAVRQEAIRLAAAWPGHRLPAPRDPDAVTAVQPRHARADPTRSVVCCQIGTGPDLPWPAFGDRMSPARATVPACLSLRASMTGTIRQPVQGG